MSRLALLALAPLVLACGTSDEPRFEESTRSSRASTRTHEIAPVAPSPLGARSWYEIELPPGARPALVPNEAIDAVHRLDDALGLTLTVLTPMPGQNDLRAWSMAVDDIFAEHPVDRFDEGTIDGVPARIGVSSSQLRWTAVADGYGLMFQCFGDEPHDEAWLHAHCDRTIESVRLVRPITD